MTKEIKIGDLVRVSDRNYIGFEYIGIVTRKELKLHTAWAHFDGMHYALYICGRLTRRYPGNSLEKVS